MNIDFEEVERQMGKYVYINKAYLIMLWIVLAVMIIACIFLFCVTFISNRGRHFKKLGYHTYIDLYKDIKLLNRKLKKAAIIVFVNDEYYRCSYKFTAGNRLVIIPEEKIKIETLDVDDKRDKNIDESASDVSESRKAEVEDNEQT